MVKLKDLVDYYENFRSIKHKLIIIQRTFNKFRNRLNEVIEKKYVYNISDKTLKNISEDLDEVRDKINEIIKIINKEIEK